MRDNQVHALLLEVGIETIAVIGSIPDEMFGLGLEHVEVETELHQGDFMMIRRMRTDGERKVVPIHNRQDFHALVAFRETHGLAATLGYRKRRIDEPLLFINGPFLAHAIRQLGEHIQQDFSLTPLLESAMDGFVVWIGLRQEVPLCTGVQNPEHRFQDGPGGDRFATGPTVRNVLFEELVSNPPPLVVAQAKHDRTYRDGCSPRQLF